MKTHLLDSSEPITECRSQTAKCGTEVKDAAFVREMADDSWSVRDVSQLFAQMNCRKCKKHPESLSGRYVYLICSGEELKERRREREAAV